VERLPQIHVHGAYVSYKVGQKRLLVPTLQRENSTVDIDSGRDGKKSTYR
jgi:hypothetical protein